MWTDGTTFDFFHGRWVNKYTPHSVTHQLLDGGNLHVSPMDMDAFRACIAKDMRQDAVPPITENHTLVFPMYVDLDLEAKVPTLSSDAVERIAGVMNSQVQRFFEDRHPLFECIVCTKTGGAKPLDGGMYKHGVHLHWPDLRVTVDEAYEIRLSIVAGLDVEDWTDALQEARVDWDKAVDKAVYSKGLRIVGAPKASKCKACGNGVQLRAQCKDCRRKGHVYDPSNYRLDRVLVGTERSDERTAHYAHNVVRLLKATSVRCDDDSAVVTPGYARYVGCPVVPMSGSKRAIDAPRVGGKLKAEPEVTDPNVLRILRTHLVAHSPLYERSRLNVKFDGNKYMVLMTGEGSHYCLNVDRDHHNHVYMVVRKFKGDKHVSHMKCWCSKPDKGLSGQPCPKYESSVKYLTQDEVDQLFKHLAKGKRAKLMHLYKELQELEAAGSSSS